jgi:uncharacterized RmlC-like cupin family protein
MESPIQLSNIFSNEHFENYPFVKLPQLFEDERGFIANIADGNLGDVAVIRSKLNSVRANHVHENDWHLSYMVSGSMIYTWRNTIDADVTNQVEVIAGELIFTPPKTPHKMTFTADSTFVAVAALSRSQDAYEQDTQRLAEGYFTN